MNWMLLNYSYYSHSVQLLGNILQWDGILSTSCLKDLALDSTLNRYILSALQTTDTAEENVHKCQKVSCFWSYSSVDNILGVSVLTFLFTVFR